MYIQTELQYVMICVNALLYWDFFQATYFTGIVIHSRLGGANQTQIPWAFFHKRSFLRN